MAGYFQLGSDVNRAQYSGEDGTLSLYGGTHTTVAQSGATLASGDTIELILAEIPAGVRVSAVKFALSATLGANTTGALVLRKKGTNNVVSSNGTTGIVPAAADRTIQVNGSAYAPTTTAAGNGHATVIPKTFEGLSPAKDVLSETYLLGFQVTLGSGAAFSTGVTVFAAVEGEFVGTL